MQDLVPEVLHKTHNSRGYLYGGNEDKVKISFNWTKFNSEFQTPMPLTLGSEIAAAIDPVKTPKNKIMKREEPPSKKRSM